MVKVILQFYPVIPAASEEERQALRPIGRNVQRYQETLEGMNEIVQVADELGVWGAASIEHHFHSEGFEVGPNPGILDAYWAASTKNIRVGQLGYVMSVQNPIRVAEETAILDHLTKGRMFVGFARGYQTRWTSTLGQHLGTPATLSDKSADDLLNREIFEEQVDMVIEAWTQESIEHNSPRWQVPYPSDTGTPNWYMGHWTKVMGAHGEMGDDGNLHRVSVVPAPYTDPHPPVFIASNASIETVEYAGRKGFIPNYFTSIDRAEDYAKAYLKTSTAAGYNFAYGQNQSVVRWPQIADSMEQARKNVAAYDGDIFKHFYAPTFAALGNDMHIARDASYESLVDPILSTQLWTIGTPDDVRNEMVAQWKRMPAEYVTLIYHYAQMPKEEMIKQLKLFMSEVKPALDEITVYDKEEAGAPAG